MRGDREDKARDKQLDTYLKRQYDNPCWICGGQAEFCDEVHGYCCKDHDCVRCDEGEFN